MDKKTGIILGIIGAIIVVLVAVVFVMDSNMDKIDVNTILEVEGKEYKIEDFEKYVKLLNHEEGHTHEESTYEEMMELYSNHFLADKLALAAAEKNGIELESGDLANVESDYEKNAEELLKENISKEDYIKYEEDYAKIQLLLRNVDDYYTLPDEIYDAVKEMYQEEQKTYTYRLMTIPYEVPESGDVSGDVAEILEDAESGDEEDLSREAQLAIAENVLARIKSGDSFEELAGEYATARYFINNDGTLGFKNGELEYATTPVLESKLSYNQTLIDTIKTMKDGELSAVIEDTESTSFSILKLEKVEEGFVGEGDKELREALLYDYANDIVAQDIDFEENINALMRMLYK